MRTQNNLWIEDEQSFNPVYFQNENENTSDSTPETNPNEPPPEEPKNPPSTNPPGRV